MRTYQRARREKAGAKGGEGTVCSCKLLPPAERIRECECTGKVGLFINVHLRAMQSITSPAKHDLFRFAGHCSCSKVSWPPCPRSLMAECK